MEAKRKYPTVGPQAESDRLASALVARWFATGWLLRRRDPDIHVDYELERVERGEPSGVIVFVQQKAHAKTQIRGGFACEELQSKHLRYYSEQLTVPIFLFVVDVGSGEGYWLFIQEWLDREHGGRVPQQKKVTVRVPTTNKLDDLPTLLSGVRKSIDYMREKHPGSIEAAARRDAGMLAAIDPRFEIHLDLVGGKKHYHFTPKCDVTFKMSFSGAAAQKVQELMSFGRPLEVETGHFSIEDFPLWEHIGGRSGILTFKPEGKELALEITAEAGAEWRVRLEGELTRGSQGLFFSGKTKNGPLACDLKLNAPTPVEQGRASIQLTWELDRWTERPISELPHFDALHEFARTTTERKRLRIDLVRDGSHLFKAFSDGWGKGNGFRQVAHLLDALAKARSVARILGVAPLFPMPEQISRSMIEDIEFAHAVTSAEGRRIVRAGHRMSMVASRPNEVLVEVLTARDQSPSAFRVLQEKHPGQLLGTALELGPLEITLDPAALKVDPKAFAEFRNGQSEELEVTIEGIGEACLTLRRVARPT